MQGAICIYKINILKNIQTLFFKGSLHALIRVSVVGLGGYQYVWFGEERKKNEKETDEKNGMENDMIYKLLHFCQERR